jgi:glycosyltransferase involved in cell wall biosynthesis
MLLIAKAEPPRWAIELIQENPTLVSFWSGGPGALSQNWDKPQYLWSSRVLKWILKWSRGQFYWIAPGNFDRPVMTAFLLPRTMRSRIVQVIHDTIPIEQTRSMSLFFRVQFSLIVRRTLAKLPFVFTVSKDSADRLVQLAPRRTQPVHILPSGIESIFGSLPRYRSLAELISARRAFLDILFAGMNEPSNTAATATQLNRPKGDELDQLVRRRWIIGVGRSQKYKGWELAETVVQQLHSDLSEGVVFVRVGGDEDGASKSTKQGGKQSVVAGNIEVSSGLRVSRSENGIVLNVESLPDEMLAQLYRCGDVLVHPSQAEGFGFPPVEAALSGLPVVYRAGTAVDGHFIGHSFHPHFWQTIASDETSVWREALLAVLRNKSGLEVFMNEMHEAVHPRSFICQRGGGQDFRWLRAAESLLKTLFSEPAKTTAEVAE